MLLCRISWLFRSWRLTTCRRFLAAASAFAFFLSRRIRLWLTAEGLDGLLGCRLIPYSFRCFYEGTDGFGTGVYWPEFRLGRC